jgi:hypothetical protein
MKRILFLLLLGFTVPISSNGQWLHFLSLGVGGLNTVPVSTTVLNNYSVTPGIGFTVVTDHYAATAEFSVASFRINPLASGVTSETTRVLLYWFPPNLEFGIIYARFGGGLGIENYRYDGPFHHETELVMGFKAETGLRYRKVEVYVEAARHRIYSYHRVNWNTFGAGFRIHIEVPQRLRDIAL